MKKTALMFMILSMVAFQSFAQESVEISPTEKEVVSEQLDKEAAAVSDTKTKELLQKVALLFRKSKDTIEVELHKVKEDCANCSGKEKAKGILGRLGRSVGKGAAWLSTTTARPFMSATGFIKGLSEKEDANKDVLGMLKFFLNHQAEFDDLYLEAGTPEEMVELMMAKVEAIMESKSRIIMKDFLLYVGIDKDLSTDFELTEEELAKIDKSKLTAAFINHHPEYQELRPFLGDMTDSEMMDLVTSGYFSKSISLDRAKEGLPKPYELALTVAGQIVVPQMALGIISKTLAGMYAMPVVAADMATGVSTAICLQKDTQAQFEADQELKQFCSYVTNRSSYLLMKSEAGGYVKGKSIRTKIDEKIRIHREKRKKKKEEQEAMNLALH